MLKTTGRSVRSQGGDLAASFVLLRRQSQSSCVTGDVNSTNNSRVCYSVNTHTHTHLTNSSLPSHAHRQVHVGAGVVQCTRVIPSDVPVARRRSFYENKCAKEVQENIQAGSKHTACSPFAGSGVARDHVITTCYDFKPSWDVNAGDLR